ncbi:MAG TPA: PKD domain-containing protein [Thermoanaerobaculaceae bacterium]|nr:PKD domain-containing protein [Thermoanaerobaculaceae bacterium]HRS16282.1 PKD domain-containing protein [Thermoanaerobaculaceae bacterium]
MRASKTVLVALVSLTIVLPALGQPEPDPVPAAAAVAELAPAADLAVEDPVVPSADELPAWPAELTVFPDQLLGVAEAASGEPLRGSVQVITPGVLTTTLLNEGFETSFPGTGWTAAFFSGNQSNATWGRTSYRKASGSYSIWCAAGGQGAVSPPGPVPYNTAAGVIVGPFDLSNATSGTLAFDYWLQTEANDQFQWLAESGCNPLQTGCSFSGLYTTTNTSGFQRRTQDLSNWGSAGNMLGKSNVWIAFVYKSDGANRFEGAYLDNVTLAIETGGSGCGTYVLTQDNDDNGWSGAPDGDWGYCVFNNDSKHPIEFHFDVNETSIASAQLLLLCNDVDEDTNPNKPEVDKVYVNNTYVGVLTGADGQDSTTYLTVPPGLLVSGRNRVRIDVNTDPRSAPGDWCVTLKQAQLIVNGGCQGTATCRSVTTNASSYAPGNTVRVTYEIDTTLASQQIRVETNLVGPSGLIVAGSEKTYTTYGSQNDPQTVDLVLPAAAEGGTYKAKIFVFDKASGRLETSCEKSFTVTGCTLACTATVPTTGQVGQAVSFTSTATPTGCTGTPEYFWTFGDGTTAVAQSQNTTFVYNAPGTYTWELVVVLGNARCVRTGTITITQGGGTTCTLGCNAVVPATATVGQAISFQGSATATNCSGSPQYFWTFGDGTTAVAQSQNTTFTYTAPGTYTWELIVVVGTTRCVRTGTVTVTSGGATCVLACDAVVPTTGTVGAPITFQGSATASNCSGTPEYFWSFGDGTTAVAQGRTITATYDMPGTYTWELSVVVNGVLCVRRGTITITGGTGTGCRVGCSATVPAVARVNQPVQFVGGATATGCTGTPEYFWFFGDGTTAVAQAQNTTWSYPQPGTYTWEFMVVIDGVWCRRSGQITIVSTAGCVLNCAAVVPATAQVGQTVTFRSYANWANCSRSPAYLWDFGDRTKPSGDATATHVYAAPGSYEWQLTTMVDGVYCVRSGVIIVSAPTQPAACTYSQWFQVGTQAAGVGANWRTDVAILNPTSSTAQVQLRLHTTTAGIKTLATAVPAGRQVLVANVAGQMGYSGSGGLQLCADRPVRANSRTYNQASASNTYGQYYGPYTTNQAVWAGELAWLVGLKQDAAFRTNIALTNTGSTTALVAVTLYNGDGTRLAGYTVSLAPGEWKQQNRVFQTYANRTDISSGFARVAVLSGRGVIVSASVIDNNTGDATTNPWLF